MHRIRHQPPAHAEDKVQGRFAPTAKKKGRPTRRRPRCRGADIPRKPKKSGRLRSPTHASGRKKPLRSRGRRPGLLQKFGRPTWFERARMPKRRQWDIDAKNIPRRKSISDDGSPPEPGGPMGPGRSTPGDADERHRPHQIGFRHRPQQNEAVRPGNHAGAPPMPAGYARPNQGPAAMLGPYRKRIEPQRFQNHNGRA